MPEPLPPTLAVALEEVSSALRAHGFSADPLTAPWRELATPIHALLGGPFDPSRPDHRLLSLRLGALFGEKFARAHKGFWYRQRDAVGGFALGFPERQFTLSPFAVAAVALVAKGIENLDLTAEKLQADRLAAPKDLPRRLTAHDYEQYFDPSLIEFFALDRSRVEELWSWLPGRIVSELKDALFRAAELPAETRSWVDASLIAPLRKLDPLRPLLEQASRDVHLVERLGELFAGRYGTGLVTEGGWNNVGLRLLCIDPDGSLPRAHQEAGPAGVLGIFLNEMPLRAETPREGVLGIFAPDQISAPHPSLAQESTLRLLRLNPRPLHPLLQKLDVPKLRARLDQWVKALPPHEGAPARLSDREQAMLDDALGFLERLRDTLALAVRDQLDFCVRRVTEAEGFASVGKAGFRSALGQG